MKEHPAESQRELAPGIVTRVYPETWEVDVQPLFATSGLVRQAKVIGHYLPEVHTEERQSKVIYGRLDAMQQAPIAIPVHNTMVPDADKPNHVHWLELLGFRITINRTGELEIRHSADGEVLISFRIHDGHLTVDATQDITINCANVTLNASGNVDAQVGGNVEAQVGGDVTAVAQGNVSASVQGNLNAIAQGNLGLASLGPAAVSSAGLMTISAPQVKIN